MSLLIKDGEIVTASQRYVADIFCENETITRIERNLAPPSGAEVVEAKGKYVFPGFIDPHVHIYLPFMGTFAKDTHETASKAALVGGTTTFIEMICPARTDEPLQAFELWLGNAEEELYKTLALAKKLGVITTAHCENADLVLELQKKLLGEGKTGPEWHHESRPPVVEAEGVHQIGRASC